MLCLSACTAQAGDSTQTGIKASEFPPLKSANSSKKRCLREVRVFPSKKRGQRGVLNKMKVNCHPKLKELARKLRKNSTKSEIRLWHHLKGKKMMGYDFHRQKPIDDFIIDFFCNKLKLVIELDGYTHTFEEVADKDELKQEQLKELGISVLRFRDEDVMKNMDGVLNVIKQFIDDFRKKQRIHTP